MNNDGVDILSFWGKARPRDAGRGPDWHPLVFHCLDVAAVGEALLKRHGGLGASLSRLLGLPREELERVVCFLLCLHDIGKFAKKFQAKAPDHYPDCFDDDPTQLGAYDHGAGGLRLFDAASDRFDLPGGGGPRLWRPLISAVAGHHGSPPAPRDGESITILHADYGKAGITAALEFIRQMHELFALPAVLPGLDRGQVRSASFALAGVAVLADWIGSNQEWFPYCQPSEDIGAYWDYARGRAETLSGYVTTRCQMRTLHTLWDSPRRVGGTKHRRPEEESAS